MLPPSDSPPPASGHLLPWSTVTSVIVFPCSPSRGPCPLHRMWALLRGQSSARLLFFCPTYPFPSDSGHSPMWLAPLPLLTFPPAHWTSLLRCPPRHVMPNMSTCQQQLSSLLPLPVHPGGQGPWAGILEANAGHRDKQDEAQQELEASRSGTPSGKFK